jgi:hypothetical protein
MITLALSKGRIFDETIPLLNAAGIHISGDADKTRKLILPTEDPALRLLVVRASDVPTYVQYGAADMGVAGLSMAIRGCISRLIWASAVAESALPRPRALIMATRCGAARGWPWPPSMFRSRGAISPKKAFTSI